MSDTNKPKENTNTPFNLGKPDFLKQSKFGRPNFGVQNRAQAPNVKQFRITQHKGGN